MTSRLFLASALGIAVAAGGIAYAASQDARALTRAEALSEAREHFARMDANKDGKLDAADRGSRHQQMAGAMFDRMDADRNGSISREEWNSGAARLAEADGKREELRHMLRMGRPARPMMGDTDGDRAISAQEFEARAMKRFEEADADKDGTVTMAERMTARGLTPFHMTRD